MDAERNRFRSQREMHETKTARSCSDLRISIRKRLDSKRTSYFTFALCLESFAWEVALRGLEIPHGYQ